MKVQVNDKIFYMDERLKNELDHIQKRVHGKDEDSCLVVDGGEGDGKSVFALQVANYLDPSFDISRVCMDSVEFSRAIDLAEKGQAVVFDEAFKGLSSRQAMSEINNLLISKIMQMRQKNLFVIIVLPSIFMLDKYVALFRAKALFHIYRHEEHRGFFVVFNKQKKKLLYLHGKKYFDYSFPKSNFSGRFTDFYPISEQEYRNKKLKALADGVPEVREPKYKKQRDILFALLNREAGYSQQRICDEFLRFNIRLDRSEISHVLGNMQKNGEL